MADLPQGKAQQAAVRGGSATDTQTRQLRVLIVDDEPNVRSVLGDACSRFGYQATTCNGGEQALAEARGQSFDVVFLDIKMPGMNGPQVLKVLRRLLPKAAFVMITGFAESELVDESLESGAFLCLSKPLSISEIRDLLQSLSAEGGDAWSLLSGPEES